MRSHNEAEILSFSRTLEPILGEARHCFQELLSALKAQLGEGYQTEDGAYLSLDYASYSTLRKIGLEKFPYHESIQSIITRISSIEESLRHHLMDFDGDSRYVSMNYLDNEFLSNQGGDYRNRSSLSNSAQILIIYSKADITWLLRAYNSIVDYYRPNIRCTHKPYNVPVYLIMDIDFVCKIFTNKQLKLTMVDTWEDPYENVFMRHILPYFKGRSLFGKASQSIYGMCWSTNEKSDGLWRIYSKDPDNNNRQYHGVQLCTTVDKILDLFSRTNFPISTYGTVTYDTPDQSLINQFKAKCMHFFAQPYPPIDWLGLESLYIKRNCFDHEKEYRTTIWIDESERALLHSAGILEDFGVIRDKFLNIPLSHPEMFFDSIVLDPRLVKVPDKESNYRKELIGAGIPDSIITRSDMYEFHL